MGAGAPWWSTSSHLRPAQAACGSATGASSDTSPGGKTQKCHFSLLQKGNQGGRSALPLKCSGGSEPPSSFMGIADSGTLWEQTGRNEGNPLSTADFPGPQITEQQLPKEQVYSQKCQTERQVSGWRTVPTSHFRKSDRRFCPGRKSACAGVRVQDRERERRNLHKTEGGLQCLPFALRRFRSWHQSGAYWPFGFKLSLASQALCAAPAGDGPHPCMSDDMDGHVDPRALQTEPQGRAEQGAGSPDVWPIAGLSWEGRRGAHCQWRSE